MSDQRITAKQTADLLGFTTTNLKHYASLLEQQGLAIYRNTRNHREYSEQDVKLLRAMQTLNRDKSMLLEDAASLVMSSDTDIDAILAPKSTEIIATIDANMSVVPHDSGDSERLLSLISTLQTELQARDALHIEFVASIDDKLSAQADIMNEQAKVTAQLLEQNEALLAKVEALEKESKRSLWSRLFGK